MAEISVVPRACSIAGSGPPHQPTVLLVDDAEDIHVLVRALLRRNGVNVRLVCAFDGCEALTLIDDPSICLIISDVNMPRMSGTELLDQLRRRGSQIPFVLTGGLLCAQDRAAPADVLISKDLLLGTLPEVINRWLPGPQQPSR